MCVECAVVMHALLMRCCDMLHALQAALVNETDDDGPSPDSTFLSRCCSPRVTASLWSGFVMATNGSIAAAIGFAIGWILKESIDAKMG